MADQLFQLIQSLTKPEKHHLKRLFAAQTRGEEPIYRQLFEAMESQTEYDEAKLNARFQQEQRKQLPAAKNYLYRYLLKTLAHYHDEQYPRDQVLQAIRQIHLLMQKQLYTAAKRLLDKTKAKAEKHELFQQLLQIFPLEMRLLAYLQPLPEQLESSRKLVQAMDAQVKKLQNTLYYRQLFVEVQLHLRSRNILDAHYDHPQLNWILNEPPVEPQEQPAVTITALDAYYGAVILYAISKKKLAVGYAFAKQQIDLNEAHSHLFLQPLAAYIQRLYQCLYFSINLQAWDDFEVYSQKLKNLQATNKTEATAVFIAYYHNALLRYRKTDQCRGLAEVVKQFTDELPDCEMLMEEGQRFLLYLQISRATHLLGQFNQSLTWLQKAGRVDEKNATKETLVIIPIQELLLHIDMGNTQLLEQRLRAAHRYLQTRALLGVGETLVLRFVRKWLNADTEADRQTLYANTRHEWQRQAESLQTLFSLFDLPLWLEAKIQGRPLWQLIE